MAHFYFQVLCLFLLLLVTSECRAATPATVSALQEQDVALSCLSSNETEPESCYRVRWIKYDTDPTKTKVAFFWPKKVQNQRVRWAADGSGQMCLFLKKIQKSDEGLYSCEIWKGWDRIQVKNISLRVRDCKHHETVNAAPSTQVKLNCPVNVTSGQQGAQNISWAMMKGHNPTSIHSDGVGKHGASLVFKSVTTGDHGWYRCNYMLGQTQRCFEIRLLVQVEKVSTMRTHEATTASHMATETQQAFSAIAWQDRKEESSHTLIAVVVAVIFGILTIAALTGLIIYRRCNTKRVPQQPQSHTAGASTGARDGYETLNLTYSHSPANQRVNSLYQFQEESLHTFKY